MKYAYQRNGTPLVMWDNSPSVPRQSRAADTVAMGSLGGGTTLEGSTLGPPVIFPRPGAPEPILSGVGGCSCSGSCGCGTALSGIADAIPGGYLTLGALAVGAWWLFKRRAR